MENSDRDFQNRCKESAQSDVDSCRMIFLVSQGLSCK